MDSAAEKGSGSVSATSAWTLLGTWGAFEYWLDPAGVNVSRRKVSSYNYLSEGAPVGARWDSTLAHFQTHVAGRLAI